MRQVKHRLNRSLLFYVFLVGTFITMVSTSLQLYLEYKHDIHYLDSLSSRVKEIHTKGISVASWNIDISQAQALLDGLVATPEIIYANVYYKGQLIAKSGEIDSNETSIKNTQALSIEQSNETIYFGEFNFYTSKQTAIDSLINSFFIVLFINFVRTFLIAGFILFIVDYLITRHLIKITGSLNKVKTFDSLESKIKLEGERNKPNELDVVVDTINEFKDNLSKLWENKQLNEETLKKQQVALIQQDKMNTLGVMVAGITHEINNPINLIKINAEIIRNSWNEILPILDTHYSTHPMTTIQNIDYDEMKGLLSTAMEDTLHSSNRIDEIIKSLSTFVRGDESLEMKPCSLKSIILDTINMLQMQIKRRGVNLVFDDSCSYPSIEANSALINQIFVNLILNAIESCDSNNKNQCEISIKISSLDDCAVITIKDNGIGIAPDDIDNIYNLFQSTKFSSGGTGIGLSIVYSLVKRHQGEISVESNLGEGSTFTVKLPFKQIQTNTTGVSLGS